VIFHSPFEFDNDVFAGQILKKWLRIDLLLTIFLSKMSQRTRGRGLTGINDDILTFVCGVWNLKT
jgi:hypothetical protein